MIGQNEPDVSALLVDIKSTIATAKIAEFENQAYRLGEIVKLRLISRPVAGDVLYQAALSNGLVREHGEDFIQLLMSEGLNCGGVQ